MSISAEISSVLAQRVGDIYASGESIMLERVARRAAKGVTEPAWTEAKAKTMTADRRAAEKLLGSIEKDAKYEISEAVEKAYKSGVISAEKDFKLPQTVMRDIEVPANIQKLVLESENLITNMNLRVLRDVDDKFRMIQAKASELAVAGVETRRQAMQRMLNMMADEGLTGFVDKAGRKWTASAYSEMATRTVTARSAITGHLDRQERAKRDLVLISDHSGSCPLCAEFAGRVFSVSGDDPKYPSLDHARAGGLFHPNCRHTLTGYIPELHGEYEEHLRTWDKEHHKAVYEFEQRQRYNERMIRHWKKRKKVALSPKEVKKTKKAVSKWQAEQRQLLQNFQSEMEERGLPDFILRRKYERESITNLVGEAGRVKTIKAKPVKPRRPRTPKAPPKPPPKPKNAIKRMTIDLEDGLRREKPTVQIEYKNNVLRKFENSDPKYQQFVDTIFDEKHGVKGYEYRPRFHKSTDAFYDPGEKRFYLSALDDMKNPRGNYATYFHEKGHAMDNAAGNILWENQTARRQFWGKQPTGNYISKRRDFYQAIEDDFDNFLRRVVDDQRTIVRKDMERIIEEAEDLRDDWVRRVTAKGHTISEADKKAYVRKEIFPKLTREPELRDTAKDMINEIAISEGGNAVSDIMGGMTDNKFRAHYGHEKSYWTDRGIEDAVSKEMFAHFSAAVTDPKSYENMKKFFPNTAKAYDKLLADFMKVVK